MAFLISKPCSYWWFQHWLNILKTCSKIILCHSIPLQFFFPGRLDNSKIPSEQLFLDIPLSKIQKHQGMKNSVSQTLMFLKIQICFSFSLFLTLKKGFLILWFFAILDTQTFNIDTKLIWLLHHLNQLFIWMYLLASTEQLWLEHRF